MSTATTARQSDIQSTPWWLVLIEGIALVLLGLLLLANPRQTSVIVVQVLGLYWLFAGILSIIKIFMDSSSWGLKLLAGIIGIIAGLLVLQYPLWSTVIVGNTLIILLGFGGIIIGGINLYHAFKGAGWGTGILGVISIILGIVLLGNVWVFRLSLPWVLGIFSLIGGIAAIVGAFRLRSEEPRAEAAPTPTESPDVAPTQEEPAQPAVAETAAVVAAAEAVPDVAEPADVEEAAQPIVEEGEPAAGAKTAEITTETTKSAEPAAVTGQAAQTHDLSYIEGVGTTYAQSLVEAGIDSPQSLLEKGATPKGRTELAEQTGISHKLILKWVNQADLYRISGVGAEYADLLEAAGVDTVVELAQRNPQNLYGKLDEVNKEKHLVRRVPAQSQVEGWVTQAKTLPRKITY